MAPTRIPEYRAWINMKSRCLTPSSTGFENYGGRGIKVCDRWVNSFDAFLGDVGHRPTNGHTLDRIDTDGDYEPGNVRWATRKEQSRNLRVNRLVTIDGVTRTLAEACEMAGMTYNTVLYRLKRGWSLTDALHLPCQQGKRP